MHNLFVKNSLVNFIASFRFNKAFKRMAVHVLQISCVQESSKSFLKVELLEKEIKSVNTESVVAEVVVGAEDVSRNPSFWVIADLWMVSSSSSVK